MEHLLQIIFDADCISWYYIYTFHFCCFHYVCFCVYDNFSWSSHFLNFCMANHFFTYFNHNFSNCYDAPLVLHRSIFKYQEEYIKGLPYSIFLAPQIPQEAQNILTSLLSFFHGIHSALIQCVTGFWGM